MTVLTSDRIELQEALDQATKTLRDRRAIGHDTRGIEQYLDSLLDLYLVSD